MKKLNKKGFTLAELLIVVAIIAVLTAIAVPLFVGAIDNAQKSTFEANKQAVKSAAIAKILGAEDGKDYSVGKLFTKDTDGNITTKEIYVSAKIDGGNITELTVPATGEKAETADYAAWKDKANGGKIVVKLTLTDITG